MAKPFDVSKFRKEITKSIDGLSIGFNDPTDWISTGNYALNYLISGDFHKGVPLGKVTVFAGESGAGKSYICSGNIIKHAQANAVEIDLNDGEGVLTLEVTDNGRGMDPEALRKDKSFGLLGLRERAAKVGGWLDVSSSPKGTSVILSVPLSSSGSQEEVRP